MNIVPSHCFRNRVSVFHTIRSFPYTFPTISKHCNTQAIVRFSQYIAKTHSILSSNVRHTKIPSIKLFCFCHDETVDINDFRCVGSNDISCSSGTMICFRLGSGTKFSKEMKCVKLRFKHNVCNFGREGKSSQKF